MFFLQDKIVPPDPITTVEKTKTLQRLNQVIQHRLVTSKLPPEMGQMIIGKNNSCDGKFVEMFVDIFSLSFCQYRESTPVQLYRIF